MVKGTRLLGFIALCLIAGSGWLLQQAWPTELAWPFGSCLHFALIGVLGLGVAAFEGKWRALLLPKSASVALAGMCLLALPASVLQIAAGKVPEYTSAALFCAIPLLTVITANALPAGESSRMRGLMMPSLIGLAGALLLFPLQDPGSLRRWLFLVLVAAGCVCVAASSVWLHQLMHGISVAAVVTLTGLGSAAILAAYGTSLGWPGIGRASLEAELLRCTVFDLPIVWLTVWLVRDVAPARLSARFILVPLVTVLENYALERGPIDSRAILAVVLLIAGGATLLFKDEPDEIPALRLR